MTDHRVSVVMANWFDERPWNSRTRKPVCGHGVFVCALHGVTPRDPCVSRMQFNVIVMSVDWLSDES